MTFQEATDLLLEHGFALQEIGEALDIAYTTIRAMRLNPESTSHRQPPQDWKAALGRLACSRARDLYELAWNINGEDCDQGNEDTSGAAS